MALPELPMRVIPFEADKHIGFVTHSWIQAMGVEWKAMRQSVGDPPPSFNERDWDCFDRNWFCKAQESLIHRLLRDPRVVVMVAVKPDDEDKFYGVAVGEPGAKVLHWVFVKKRLRQAHVATRLLHAMFGEEQPIQVTARSRDYRHLYRWRPALRTYRFCEVIK